MAGEVGPATGVELSPEEGARLEALEQAIERGLTTFVEVGQALLEIRDQRLYRATHTTFEQYLAERWHMARRTGYAYIDAAAVAANLPSSAKLNVSQAAELARLSPEEQRDLAREVAGLTIAQTRAAVRRRIAEKGGVTAAKSGHGAQQSALVRLLPPAEAADDAHPFNLLGDALVLLLRLDEATRDIRGELFQDVSDSDRLHVAVQLRNAIGLLSELLSAASLPPAPLERTRRSFLHELRLGMRRGRADDS
jgi:hypothetical protein